MIRYCTSVMKDLGDDTSSEEDAVTAAFEVASNLLCTSGGQLCMP